MNNIANKQIICEELIAQAKEDKDIIVLASDSKGSASMAEFEKQFPQQFIEMGIAEQNLVGVGSGLAAAGKKPYITSPACFLSMRSAEQVKVDLAYSNTNVKLIGISGGISYGALGMSHHSVQDLALMRAIPNMTVMIPADRYETASMMKALKDHVGPAYIRVGRNPVPDVYDSEPEFHIGKANVIQEGNDIAIMAIGEMVTFAKEAACLLEKDGLSAQVLNIHTIKPLDEAAIIEVAKKTSRVITVEEHSIYNGLGSAVAQVLGENYPVKMKILGIPDEPAIAGKSGEVYEHYGLTGEAIYKVAKKMIQSI